MGASGAVLQKILVSKTNAVFQRCFGRPAQTAEAGHVHQLAGCAVWFAGVETEVALETHDFNDGFRPVGEW